MNQHIRFIKMHGLGNDFIVIDAINQRIDPEKIKAITPKLCEQRFGIGADGVVTMRSSECGDLRMQVINKDGSEPEMCGNGLRCLVKAAYDEKIIQKECVSVETKAGIRACSFLVEKGEVQKIEVDMGVPKLGFKTASKKEERITLKGKRNNYEAALIDMGNPHAVIEAKLDENEILQEGAILEWDTQFLDRCNIEFVQTIDQANLKVDVWERGAGRTLACGTGACAAAVAHMINHQEKTKITIHLPGGQLVIEWPGLEESVTMIGPAKTVYHGECFI